MEGKQWCGCFTPSEVLALIAAGVQITEHGQGQLEYIQARYRNGECSPSWFYFYPHKAGPRLGVNKHKKHDKSPGV